MPIVLLVVIMLISLLVVFATLDTMDARPAGVAALIFLAGMIWIVCSWEQDSVEGFYLLQNNVEEDGAIKQFIKMGNEWDSYELPVSLNRVYSEFSIVKAWKYKPYSKGINWMNGHIVRIDPRVIVPSNPYYQELLKRVYILPRNWKPEMVNVEKSDKKD